MEKKKSPSFSIFLQKGVDKAFQVWYYIKAVSNGGPKTPWFSRKAQKSLKNLKKVLDKENQVW